MSAPAILSLISLLGVAAALILPGASDLILLAGPCTIASLFLLLRDRRRRRAKSVDERWIVIDGSNIMYWNQNKPDLRTVRTVMDRLTAAGFKPGVVFDANAGYKTGGVYMNDRDFAQVLGLPKDRVMVAPKGSPADPLVLTAARDLGALVVSNDRFRDWVEDFPETQDAGLVVRGGYRDGALWLDLPAATA